MTTSNNSDIVNIPLHPQAENLVRELSENFTANLLLQSKLLAHQRKHELVLTRHVDEALEIIYLRRERNWLQELLILAGGILLGTFLQGFANELTRQTLLPMWIAIYVILGFIGATMLGLGFIKRYGSS